MGAEESVPMPPPPPGFDYLIVVLANWNRSKIRVMFGGQTDYSHIREAIFQFWGQGIDMEKPKLGLSWTFNIKGYPFSKGNPSVLSACARQMIGQMLQNLNNGGWELKMTSDLSRRGDLTTFFFRRTQVPKSIQFPLMCVGLSSMDKLQLVNAPENMIAVIKDTVVKTWRRGIQSEGPNENSYEIKLFGNPWLSIQEESVQARLLLTMLITALVQQHWVLHATANIKSTSDNLFFRYDPEAAGPQVCLAQYFTISLNSTDKLRLINAPHTVIPVIQQVIASTWAVMGGIQKEKEYFGSWQFKLTGNPWWSTGNEAVMARFLICKILEALQGQGWEVKASIDVSRSARDKSVLVFAPSQQPPESSPVMCLSFSDVDKIRLINAPQEFIGICRDVLLTKWYKGIAMEEQMKSTCPAHAFKLNGTPWNGVGNESQHIRGVVAYLVQAFTARGWKYLVSADVSARYHKQGDNGPEYPVDVHSLWFTYAPGAVAQPSAPMMPSTLPPPPSYDDVVKQ